MTQATSETAQTAAATATKPQKKRLRSVDIAKGIAILSIVLGHMYFQVPKGNFIFDPWVFEYHVPVFFVIAGYFLSKKRSLKVFFADKAKRLLLPYLITALVIIAVIALLQLCTGNSWPAFLGDVRSATLAALYGCGSWLCNRPFGVGAIGAIWFLLALFVGMGIARLLMEFKYGLLLTIPIAFICYYTAQVFFLPFSIQPGGTASMFIAFGYWLRQKDFLNRPFNWWLFAACTAFFIVAGIFNWKMNIAGQVTGVFPGLSYLVGASGSVWLLMLSRLIEDYVPPLDKLFTFFGISSMVVLCVHMLFVDLGMFALLSAITGLDGNALSAVNFAVQLVLFTACIPLFKRIPGVNKIFY